MTPMTYLVKTGCATVAELASLMRTDKASADTLKRWATEEMTHLGLEVTSA